MGSWSNNPFGNDTALDWTWGLKGDQGEEHIQSAIDKACKSKKPLDAPDAEEAVAAAAVIAGATTEPVRQLSQEIKSWIRTRGYVPPKTLIDSAIKAVDAIMKDSELRELWDESESLAGWLKATMKVRDRLEAARNTDLPVRKPKKPGIPRLLHKLVERYRSDPDPAIRDKIRRKIANLEDVNEQSKETSYQTPLTLIAEAGLVEEACTLIERGADVNRRAKQVGLTPITAACKGGSVEMLRVLAEAGADFFEEIIIDANTGMEMDFDQDRAQAKPVVFRFSQALYFAARYGNADMFDFLESIGADIRQLDINGETLLHKAGSGGNVEAIRHLISRGLDVEGGGSYHETPLFNAVRAGKYEAIRLLIEYGADVNRLESYGGRPLDYAGSNRAIIRLLKQHGAIGGEEPDDDT